MALHSGLHAPLRRYLGSRSEVSKTSSKTSSWRRDFNIRRICNLTYLSRSNTQLSTFDSLIKWSKRSTSSNSSPLSNCTNVFFLSWSWSITPESRKTLKLAANSTTSATLVETVEQGIHLGASEENQMAGTLFRAQQKYSCPLKGWQIASIILEIMKDNGSPSWKGWSCSNCVC